MTKFRIPIRFTKNELAILTSFSIALIYYFSVSSFSFYPDSALPIPKSRLQITRDVAVTVTGAVAHPGTYYAEKGTPISGVVSLAGITDESDPKFLNNKQKINKPTKIHVPSKRDKRPQRKTKMQ